MLKRHLKRETAAIITIITDNQLPPTPPHNFYALAAAVTKAQSAFSLILHQIP
jgi:hypothetical protein